MEARFGFSVMLKHGTLDATEPLPCIESFSKLLVRYALAAKEWVAYRDISDRVGFLEKLIGKDRFRIITSYAVISVSASPHSMAMAILVDFGFSRRLGHAQQ